ncbi:MAG: hypothetical protein U5N27_24305 [Rhizobium sp.]|nr:hypothetical protein [Rhizobium sp.]
MIGQIHRFAAQVLLAADDDGKEEGHALAISERLGFVIEQGGEH